MIDTQQDYVYPKSPIEDNIVDVFTPTGPYLCEGCHEVYPELYRGVMEIVIRTCEPEIFAEWRDYKFDNQIEMLKLYQEQSINRLASMNCLSGEYFVSVTYTLDGEYIDSDEFLVNFDNGRMVCING